jgi:hypothetical protein
MEGFQKTVLFAAIFILILSLIFIGLALKNSTNQSSWPPMVPACPDYWTIDGSGNNTTCVNVKNLGTCQPASGDQYLTMNFNNAPYSGSNGLCSKYTWATNCGVSWDGITYGVSNPCQTTTSTSSTTTTSTTSS